MSDRNPLDLIKEAVLRGCFITIGPHPGAGAIRVTIEKKGLDETFYVQDVYLEKWDLLRGISRQIQEIELRAPGDGTFKGIRMDERP